MKFRSLILVIILLFAINNLNAESSATKVIGLGNLEEYIPKKDRKIKEKALLKFHARIRGLGTARFLLDYEKNNKVNAFYVDKNGNEQKADLLITLIEGYAKIRGKNDIPVHASIFNNIVKIEFNIISPKGLYNRHYEVFIDRNKKARTKRVTVNKSFFAACSTPSSTLKHNDNSLSSQGNIINNDNPKTNATIKVLDIGVDADQDWFEDFGNTSQSELLSIVSAADTIYRDQLGLSFNIKRLAVFTNKNFGGRDANNQVDAFDMIFDYQDYTITQDYFSQADNFHLFSSAKVKDGMIGLAYVGVICSKKIDSFGFSSRSEFDGTETLTFAHEIGHNFNANHTDSGIMKASLDFPLPETFSNFSLTEINNYVQNNNSCLLIEESDDDDDDDDDDEEEEDEDENDDDDDSDTNPDPPINDGNNGNEDNAQIEFTADIGPFSENKISVNFDQTYNNCDFKIRASTIRRLVSHGEIIYLAKDQTNLSSLEFNVNYNRKPWKRNRRNGRRNRFYIISQLICDNGVKGEGPIIKVTPDYSVSNSNPVRPKRWLRSIGKNLELVI